MSDLPEKPTKSETAQFKKSKSVIRKWCNDRFKVGEELWRIQEQRLYRGEFGSFEAFIQKEYNWTRDNAYKLISGWEKKKSLPPDVENFIQSPSQAEAISKVDPAKQQEVIETVAASGKVTAAKIEEVAKSIGEAAKKDDAPRDCNGKPIPKDLIADWLRSHEVGAEVRSHMSHVKNIVAAGIRDGDIIFNELLNPTIAEIDSLRYTLSQIIPHALCTTCQGRARKSCTRCKRRGWLSKHIWESSVSKQEKAMAEKAGKACN